MPDGDTSIFSQKESIFKKHISQDLVKEFKCDTCGRSCPNKSTLITHIERVHEGRKDFKCDICGFLTYESRLLENHKRCKHEKRRDFKCEACNRLFSLRHIIKECKCPQKVLHECQKSI